MLMFKLLAHGGLGNWDESIFLGVSVIFILMMCSRALPVVRT